MFQVTDGALQKCEIAGSHVPQELLEGNAWIWSGKYMSLVPNETDLGVKGQRISGTYRCNGALLTNPSRPKRCGSLYNLNNSPSDQVFGATVLKVTL